MDGTEKFQTDPHWRDLILFNGYFNGDNATDLVPVIKLAGQV